MGTNFETEDVGYTVRGRPCMTPFSLHRNSQDGMKGMANTPTLERQFNIIKRIPAASPPA